MFLVLLLRWKDILQCLTVCTAEEGHVQVAVKVQKTYYGHGLQVTAIPFTKRDCVDIAANSGEAWS